MFNLARRSSLVLAATLLLAAAPADPAPPSVVFGPLFRAVQLAHVFPDQKTFADAVPRRATPAIMADYARLRREHPFWMAGEHCATRPCARVVRMPDGALLDRYWDDRAAPREESYSHDGATADAAAPRAQAETWRYLRAAAESG